MPRTIATELALSGEREFNDAMKSVNSNLKTLKSDMSAVSAEFAGNANSVEALTAKQRVLQEQVAQQQAKHDALAQHLEHVKAVYDDSTAKVAELQAKYDAASASLEKMRSSGSATEAEIEKQSQVVDDLGAALDKASAAAQKGSSAVDKYKQELNQSSATLAKFKASLNQTNSEIKNHSALASKISSRVNGDYVPAYQRAKAKTDELKDAIKQLRDHTPGLTEALDVLSVAGKGAGAALEFAGKGAKASLSAIAKGAAAAVSAGAAATGAVTAVAVSGVNLLVDYATEAASNAQTNYDKAQDLAAQAAEALKNGNKDQAAELQAQSDAYMDQVDFRYLQLSQSISGFQNASQEAKAALGGILLPVLGELAGEGGALLNDFARDMAACGGDTAKMGQTISTYLRKAVALVRQQLPEIMGLAGELLQGLTDGLLENLDPLLDDAQAIIETLLQGLLDHADEIGTAAVEILGMLIQTLISAAPELLTTGMTLIVTLIDGLTAAMPELIPAAVDLITQLLTALIENAPLLLSSGYDLIVAIVSGLLESVGLLLGVPPEVIDDLVRAFQEQAEKVKSIGTNIVRGIWAGIQAAKEWLYSLLSGWVNDVVDWIKGRLGIESPSKVMRDQVGRYMAQGVGVGWEEEMRRVNKQIAGDIQTRFDVDVPGSSAGGAGGALARGGGKIFNVTRVINIHAQKLTRADLDYILDYVNRNLPEVS